jgi:hypothetical protein
MPFITGFGIDEHAVFSPESCDVVTALLSVGFAEDSMDVFA